MLKTTWCVSHNDLLGPEILEIYAELLAGDYDRTHKLIDEIYVHRGGHSTGFDRIMSVALRERVQEMRENITGDY